MKKKIFTALGLMTGTSIDGIDLSIIKSDGYTEFTHILDEYHKFEPKLQERLINLRNKLFTTKDLENYSQDLDETERDLTLFVGQIINKLSLNYINDVDLIGFHGQTIFHNPEKKISKQLGNGKLLSQLTKKIVINNFRNDDLINNGQGAPLTPIFHSLLSRYLNKNFNLKYPMNIINIGGITNITQILSKNNSEDKELYAYDIGPGNCLIDEWVQKNSKNKFDDNGKFAKAGKVNDLILNLALDNFDIKTYCKSMDVKDFDISFVKGLTLEDGCATLTKFSGILIAKGIEYLNNLNNISSTINLVCGGGRKNLFLINSISDNFLNKENKLENLDKYGLDGDFIESQAFAYISIRSFLRLPISFPNTTRCKSPTVGGVINKNF